MLRSLWKLRVEKNLSLRDLESLSGVSRSSINTIENGGQTPKIDTVYMLARALALPPDELFEILIKGENFYKDGASNG